MKEYFKLQYKIINRHFKDTGIKPVLAYFILTLGFFGISIYLFSKSEFFTYLYLLFALSLLVKLSETRRTEFLKICFGNLQLKRIRIAENLICSIPFLIFLIYKKLYIISILFLISTTILALLNFRTSFNFTIWTPFSKRPFEFTIGFRNSFYLFFIAYALTTIAVSVNNFNLGVFAMMLVFAIIFSFYTNLENEFYVWSYTLKPIDFLFSKLKIAFLYSSILTFPIILVLSIFFNQNILLILLFYLAGWAFLTAIILSKYSSYPNKLTIPQGILLSISFCFPPFLFILIPYFFQKSKIQLNNILK